LQEIEEQGCPVWRTPSPDLDHAQSFAAGILKPFRKVRQKLDLAAPPAPPPRLQSARIRMMSGTATFARRMLALPDDRFPWLATAIPAAEHIMRSHAVRFVLTSSYPNSTHLIGLYLKR